jgi:hypothetical protein
LRERLSAITRQRQRFILKRVEGKVGIHHRDTEDAEGAQSKEITESRFEISDLFSELVFLCATSAFSAPLW